MDNVIQGNISLALWLFGSFYRTFTMVKVAFLHPDLGIGGAERLVVDAAVALQVRWESGVDIVFK